jgi:hypothetical protein
MRFDEMLQICLLALENRYPDCVIEGNKAVLSELALPDEAIASSQMFEFLQASAPHLLQAPARMIVDEQQSNIYLLAISEEQPAFRLYCEGCSSHQRAKQWQKAGRK